jgi:hypothetical protein
MSSPPKSFDSVKKIFNTLASVIEPGNPTDSRRLALVVVRTLSRADKDMVRPHITILAQPIFASVRDPVIPVKLAAEAAFVELFNVADEENKVFEKFMAGPGSELPANTQRSMIYADIFWYIQQHMATANEHRVSVEPDPVAYIREIQPRNRYDDNGSLSVK